jgi:diguanylate cyclase (GGDEF)-like protein
MKEKILLAALNKHPVFSELMIYEHEKIAQYCSSRTLNKAEVIIRPGEIKKDLYFLIEGKIVSTLKLPGSIERTHGLFLPGDFIGEISFFGNRPSFDTYLATVESQVIVIGESSFKEFMENHAELSTRIISKLMSMTVKRFRASSRFLTDIVEWGESASRRVITDEITGLYNRAFLDDALENFFYISRDNNKPLSLLMIDIDNFRTINETLGHDTADEILSEVVQVFKDAAKNLGILARYGGDEFSILLPEADLKKALSIAENIRLSVEKRDYTRFLKGEVIPITVSIGVSSFPESCTSLEAFKHCADKSLYRSKELGRNRVEIITGEI